MWNKEQSQDVGEGATAIQAGGNVTIKGLQFTEVRELCVLLLRDNFPRLREEARQVAEEHVKQFAIQLEVKIADNLTSVVIDKFRDPDVQAAINDAVQSSARKGDAANPDILVALILKKMSADCNSFKDIVFTEAVQVAPKLTREQISFLAFVLIMQIYVFCVDSWEQLERRYQLVEHLAAPGFDVSETQRQHIHYSGAASVAGRNAVRPEYNMFEAMEIKYAEHGLHSFRSLMHEKAPTLVKLINQYKKLQGDSVALTSVGLAIVAAYLSSFGFVDMDLLADK